MILFALYAAAIWFLALRFRRRVAGFAIAIGAGVGVAALTKVLPQWMDRRGMIPMSILLWGEAVMVAGIGVFIASLPRTPPGTTPCGTCGYDLRGLGGYGSGSPVCPECGTSIPAIAEAKQRPPSKRAGSGNGGSQAPSA